MSSVNKAGLAAFQSTNALRNMGGTQAMTSTQDEREKHIASLRSLSAWLIANDHDMKLPDDVIDPDLAADFLASLPAPDTAGEVVAWVYERKNPFPARYYHEERVEAYLSETGEYAWTETPLYAAPQATVTGDLLAAMKDGADALDGMLDRWVTGTETSDEQAKAATAALLAMSRALNPTAAEGGCDGT